MPGLEPVAADGAPDLGSPDLERDHAPRADLSQDACLALGEVCDNADDNCNGQADGGFDKLTDARYCEFCKGCANLATKNALPACAQGTCVISGCTGGFIDLDKDMTNGCEYRSASAAARSAPEVSPL